MKEKHEGKKLLLLLLLLFVCLVIYFVFIGVSDIILLHGFFRTTKTEL
jgi:hypothetical protein